MITTLAGSNPYLLSTYLLGLLSDAIGEADTDHTVTYDIDGQLRINPDVGADER